MFQRHWSLRAFSSWEWHYLYVVTETYWWLVTEKIPCKNLQARNQSLEGSQDSSSKFSYPHSKTAGLREVYVHMSIWTESDCMSFSPEETNAPPEVDENKLHMTTKTFSNGEFTGFLLSINILLFGSLRIFLLTILVVPNFQNSKCSVWLQTALSYHLLVVDRNSVQMLH